MVQTLIHAHGHIFALRTYLAEYFLKTSDCFRQISAQGASIRIWLISIPLFLKNVIKTWCYFMLTLQKCANLIIDEVLGLVHNITEKWPTFWSLYSNVNADAYKWFVIFIILKKKMLEMISIHSSENIYSWEAEIQGIRTIVNETSSLNDEAIINIHIDQLEHWLVVD